MKISIMLPTYRRPDLLRIALAGLAAQEPSLIGEILIGDDSPAAERLLNQAVIRDSTVSVKVRYFAHETPRGNYPNQWFLARCAIYPYLMLVHDDDYLCDTSLQSLASAACCEKDARVAVWFGRNLVMDAVGEVDLRRSEILMREYGKDGEACVRSMSDWCLTHALPPNSYLLRTQTYLELMRGPRDGNVGDIRFAVRLANSGAWGRFLAQDIYCAREHLQSVTYRGRGADVHYEYEAYRELQVQQEREFGRRLRLRRVAMVATVRYLRDGERAAAWACYLSHNWSARMRISARGVVTAAMLLLPRACWMFAIRHRSSADVLASRGILQWLTCKSSWSGSLPRLLSRRGTPNRETTAG